MNAIDDAIRDLLHRFEQASPPAPAFSDLRSATHPNRVPAMIGAAVLVTAALIGLAALDNQASPTTDVSITDSTPTAASVPDVVGAAAATAGSTFLAATIDSDQVPLITVTDAGWWLDTVYGTTDAGSEEPAVVLVGAGPLAEAPSFTATLLADTTATDTSIITPTGSTPWSEWLPDASPIDIAGHTGYLSTSSSGTTNDTVLLFVAFDAGAHIVRINASNLPADAVAGIAATIQIHDGSLDVQAPTGMLRADTAAPDTTIRRLSTTFTTVGASIEIVGTNQGRAQFVSHTIGQRLEPLNISGADAAVEVDTSSEYRVHWLAGDWSFYAIVLGLDSVEEVSSALASLQLVDADTYQSAAEAAGVDLVMPGDHADLAAPVLDGLDLTDEARRDAQTTELPTIRYHFDFELYQGAACHWAHHWAATTDNDERARIEQAVATAVDRLAGTDLKFMSQDLHVGLLLPMQGGLTEQLRTYGSNDCPAWSE